MFNYILYRIGQFIALATPVKIGYAIAVFCSDVHYMFARMDRQRVMANLKVIFPEKSEREIRRIRIRMSRNFAKYLVDFFRFEKLDKDYIAKNIRLKNCNYYDEALSKGKGVIALSAHLGNWELGGVVVALLGYPFWAVVLPHKDKKVDKFFVSQRQRKGVKVTPLGKAAMHCLNALRNNEIIALVGDRNFTGKGITMDFFGKPTILPRGPAEFALRTGAPIIPAFMVRNPDESFTLMMEKPIEFTPTDNKERDVFEITALCKNVIEEYVRRYPDQWYMYVKFWIEE